LFQLNPAYTDVGFEPGPLDFQLSALATVPSEELDEYTLFGWI
jgi:hypothetical protein